MLYEQIKNKIKIDDDFIYIYKIYKGDKELKKEILLHTISYLGTSEEIIFLNSVYIQNKIYKYILEQIKKGVNNGK